jgi:hypothetical protein
VQAEFDQLEVDPAICDVSYFVVAVNDGCSSVGCLVLKKLCYSALVHCGCSVGVRPLNHQT